MKILIADDDPEVLLHLTSLLTEEGHQVAPASHGAEALRLLEGGRFDALVSDLEMPEVDGETLIRRAQERWPDLRILVLSGHPDAGRIAETLGVEALPKSVPAPRLLTALASTEHGSPERATRGPVELPESPVVFRSPSRSSRRSIHTWGLGIAAILALAISATFLLPGSNEAPPALPDRPDPGTLRGTVLEIFEPSGPLAAAPRRLRWETAAGATGHRVVFERVDGQVILRHSPPWQLDAEGAQVFDLPDSFRESLQPMAVYHWWVEALDADGGSIARSPRERFRILVDPSSSSSTGDF